MKTRVVALSAVVLVGCSLAGTFVYAEHRAAEDRRASAAICAAVPLGVSVPVATELIRSQRQVRLGGELGQSDVVALEGPAYCFCKFSLGADGMIGSSMTRCHH